MRTHLHQHELQAGRVEQRQQLHTHLAPPALGARAAKQAPSLLLAYLWVLLLAALEGRYEVLRWEGKEG